MARRILTLAPSAGAIVAALLLLPAAGAAPGATFRVSVAGGGAQSDGRSSVPAISADDRYSAFHSDASNLVSADTNFATDVFVHDRSSSQTERVSVAGSGAEGNADSFSPAISANGRFVAFYSAASNLVDGDANGVNDVFVRDRQERTTVRVSLAPAGASPNGGSSSPSISADGRFVAFLSDASNLVADDLNRLRDVFVVDRQTGTTTRASVDSAGAEANLESFSPVLSADGRFVVFTTFAFNLVADDINEGSDVFVRDLQAQTTTRVSVYEGGYEAEGDSLRPAISADGRIVAFDSDAWNLAWGDTNDDFDVFIHDRDTGVTTRVSVDDSGGQADGASLRPALSADGRYVAFYTEAANLVPGDTNGASDVLIYDRQSGAEKRVSVAGGGVEANGDSLRPALSADGRVVVFESNATNLVAGDSNGFTDVFLHDRNRSSSPRAVVRCRVPRVIGMRLAVARTRIGRASCKVGRVRRARSRRVGKVLGQSPSAGAVRPRGTKVNLTVGRR